MLGHHYYHRLIRKYVATFGTLFNDIQINRFDKNGNTKELIKVPISYGPKEKFYQIINRAKDGYDPTSSVIPRLGFEMTGLSYNPTKKLNNLNRFIANDATNPNSFNTAYSAVYYDIGFQLTLYVKNTEDGTQVIEQILPFFTPEVNTTVNLIPEINNPFDIAIILNSVNQEDDYQGDYQDRRFITWTLDFTMKALFIGPITNKKPIKTATLNTGDLDTSQIQGTITTIPIVDGKTLSEISSEDDFGFSINIQ